MQRRWHARPWRTGGTRQLHIVTLIATLLTLWSQGFSASLAEARPMWANNSVHFPETGFSVSGPFLRYWQDRGGLFSYGYPITGPREEDGLRVQYFERARMEWHPENAGSEYEVLLSPLGSQLARGRDFREASPTDAIEGTYFSETGHNLQKVFLHYWNEYGGLSRFGYPISEELEEGSNTGRYRVQYFERARMEWHPENEEPYDVLLGQIGKQILTLREKAQTYVTTHGNQLVRGTDLATFKIKGFNYFPRDYAWTDFEQWPADRVAEELDTARGLGANTLRVFIRKDAFGGAAAAWGNQEGFERFVQMARDRGFMLVVGLFDGYRKWPNEGWNAWVTPGTPEEAEDLAYLHAVVGKWVEEPAILAWDIYNEPDFVSDTEFLWDDHRRNRINWLARMVSEVRQIDGNHLLTIGVALAESNFLTGLGGTRVADMVDFLSVHYYTRNYPGKSLWSVLDETKQLTSKPIVVEEMGQATLVGGVDDSADEAVQAQFLNEAMGGAQAADVSGVLIWTLYDFPTHANGSEGYYGLLRADDTHKPAAEVFRAY